MTSNIKHYVFIVIFIVLAVDFGGHERTIFVDGRATVEILTHPEVDIQQPSGVDPEVFGELDHETNKQRLEQRRSAHKPKVVADVGQPTHLVARAFADVQQEPWKNERRQVYKVSNHKGHDNGLKAAYADSIIAVPNN